MAHKHSWGYRAICWITLLVFYIQSLNPALLGYTRSGGGEGAPLTQAEITTAAIWEQLSDLFLPAAAQAAPPPQSAANAPLLSLSPPIATHRDYVPAYAQVQANSDPLLASTPEFDLTDPYLVGKATELGNDPQRIFAFVRDTIGFESYVGSLRGARGALWSNAGNALDQASLLVALLRISGIPARYAQGTLPKEQAQELIASMFLPAPYRVVGFVPDDAEKSDPVNDLVLIAEAQAHFWVEFQQGGAFIAADPAFRSASLGWTFTTATGQFAEVPDALRHKVRVWLEAETEGGALNPEMARQTVLDHSFTSAELVGKPLSIAHFVNSSAQGGMIGVNYTHTYSPYLLVGQNDGDISDDPLIRGEDYQELISNIFGSLAHQVVTGVFLHMEVIQPGRQTESFERALVDRIGYTARNSSAGAHLDVDVSGGQAALMEQNIMTLTINSDNLSDSIIVRQVDEFNRIKSEILSLSEEIKGADVNNLSSDQKNIIKQLNVLTRNHAIAYSRYLGMQFSATSYNLTQQAQTATLVKAYFDSSRILASSVRIERGEAFAGQFDLTKNDIRTISFPLQSARAVMVFNIQHGIEQLAIEDFVLSSTFSSSSGSILKETNVLSIFKAAKDQGIKTKVFGSRNIQEINTGDYSEEAKIRISNSVSRGNIVLIPSRSVLIQDTKKIGWLEIDPISGKLIDTFEDGRHLSILENILFYAEIIGASEFALGFAVGNITGIYAIIGVALLPVDIKREINVSTIFNALIPLDFEFATACMLGSEFCLGLIAGFNLWMPFLIYYINNDPVVPYMLVGVAASNTDPVIPNTQPSLNALLVSEPFFTLPVGHAQLTSLYRLYIKSTDSVAKTYRVTFPNPPTGFTIKSSLPEVTIPAGETGVVGILLVPENGLPAPGAQAPFQVTITDTATHQSQTTPTTTFTTPEVVGITLDGAPAQSATAPGGTVNATLRVKSVGNVAAPNIPLTLDASAGLGVSGLPATVSLGLGETKTFPLTLTANSTTLNDTLRATITASFGQDLDGNPYQASATLGVTLASETAQAAFCGVQPASAAVRNHLASTLNNLAITLNQLEAKPISASLSLNPQAAPPGTVTTQAELTLIGHNLTPNPQIHALAQIDTQATARSLAVQGDYAYVCGSEDITIFNIQDPRHPQIVKTFADAVINNFGVSICRIMDNHLIVNAQETESAGSLRTFVFDLADPTAPALVSSTNLPYRFAGGWYARGKTAFVPFSTLWSDGKTRGDFAAFDYSDLNQPKLTSALYGFQGMDGGGLDSVQSAVPLGDSLALLGMGDGKGSSVSSRGRILTVNTADPAHMTILQDTTVPGTKYVFGLILVDGVLWALGTNSATLQSGSSSYTDLTLSAFDASDPLNLKLLKSIPIQGAARGYSHSSHSMSSLGNGFIAIGSLRLNNRPVLTVVDVSNPLNPRYYSVDVAADLGEIQRRDNILFTPSDAGLGLYDIGQVLGTSYTARVPIPKNTGVNLVANSFNIPPTRIESGNDADTLVWEGVLNYARSQETLSWRLQATNLAPGEARPVTGATRIDFTILSTGEFGQLNLPPVELVAQRMLALTSGSRTVKSGETTRYTSGIENTLYRDRALALLDNLIAQFNGPALTPLIPGLTAARTALANGDPNALADLRTQLGQLCATLADSGEDLLLFELSLLSASGVAQPGSPTRFYIQLRNTSDQTASFNLSLGTLPAGVTGQLNLNTVTLAPGESTSVDQGQQLFVTLTPSTQAIQTFEFTVTAALAGSSLSRAVQGILLARSETLQITNVQATPGFTEPGGLVQISADILSAVNQSRPLQAIYSVKDANGAVVFTSTPKAFTTSVIGTLTTVDLGALDTTGYAKGQYSVEVALREADGTPLNGITNQGSLLIGTPLTASLSLNPQLVPPGDVLTQASLILTSQTAIQNPEMKLLAQIDTKASARSLAVQGDYAYVCGTEDITIFNISDPRHPQVVGTVADDVMNGFGISICRIIDNHLIVNAQENISAGSLRTLVFDLSNPTAPVLVSSTNLPYRFAGYWYAKGRIAFVPFGTKWSNGPVQGDFATFDYSDFTAPTLISALWGFKGMDGGGPDAVSNAIPVDDRYALLGIGDAKGQAVSARGRILTVDTMDPAHMAIVQDTTVPGTKYVIGMTLVDHILWVLGTDYATFEWVGNPFDYPNLTLTPFDATDPLDLKVLQSIPLPGMTTRGFANTMSSLGNGFIAIGGLWLNGKPLLTVVDVNDPQNPRYSTREAVADLGEIQRRENILFTPSDAGLGFYDIGQVVGLSYRAQVQIPKNTSVSLVADSFNIPPSRIDTGSDFDTLVWERALNNARPQDTLIWQLQAIDMAPAEARPVTGDTLIDFTASTGDAGQLTLPPVELVARQVITLTPQSRTVKPGETASYTLGIENPTDQPVSYDLSVQGTPNGWAQLASPVTIPAQGHQNLPLNLVTTAASEVGQYGFVVTATANTNFTAYLLGTLILQQEGGGGELGPDMSNPAQGVSITLTPTLVTAGLGTAATYTARVTNLGDETTTFNLTGAFPAGFTAALDEASVTLLPGLSNYRDVLLTLTPPVATNPGDYGFSVTATAAGAPAVTDQATGTVKVVNLGVDVALSPGAAALSTPTTTARATLPTFFTLRVTNTGRVRETYDLALAGPLALYATLALSQITLDPGASQNVLINVAAIDTALPGDLRLVGIATAHSDARVQDSATITLNVPASRGLEVAFDPKSQTLPAPGPATFLLRVQNTGNVEEAYQAVITTTTGPVSAALEGLDGQPTQRIETFRLPALSTGLVTLDTTLQQRGTGQVTVTVNTLAAPALSDADAATVLAQNQPPPPPPPPPSPPSTVVPIPTLNEWMQGLLALLLLLIALVWVSRRRHYSS